MQNTRQQLKPIYDGLTALELQDQLADARAQETVGSIRERLVRDAIDLIWRDSAEEVACPICHELVDRQTLVLALDDALTGFDGSVSTTVIDLEHRHEQSNKLQDVLVGGEGRLQTLRVDEEQAIALLDHDDRTKLSEANDIDQMIQTYSQKESTLNTQVDDQAEWFTSRRSALNKLKEESRFHQIQRRLNRLGTDRRELERIIHSYDNLVAYGESVRTIKETVSTCLSKRIAMEIPRISEILSKSFAALTQHPWYDRLIISQASLPKLQLRVGSTQDTTNREDRTGVLNGQSERALSLVPYFAFSQTDVTPTEVYLVMLDDPTQAQDIEHTNILLTRLGELGRNVQLIVASQETERFRTMIPQVFGKNEYIIIEPTGWSPDNGPSLTIYE